MNQVSNRLLFKHKRHFVIGLGVVAVGLLVFGVLGATILHGNALARFDLRLNAVIRGRTTPYTLDLFRLISLLGFQILCVIAMLVSLFLALKRKWIYLNAWITAWAGGLALNAVLKPMFARPWPYLTYSYPSGHAMFAVIAYGLLAYFVLSEWYSQPARVAVILGTITLVLLIGLSRVLVGAHYVSDVLGGFAMGAAWLSVCITATQIIRLLEADHFR